MANILRFIDDVKFKTYSMKQTYYSSPSGSAKNQNLEPKPETIRRILEFSRTLEVIHTDSMDVEIMLN